MSTQLTRSQITIIGSVLFMTLLLVGIFTGILPGTRSPSQKLPQVSLTIWGIDPSSNFAESINQYRIKRNNVSIEYKQIPEGTFERDVVDALASGSGPDIIMFHNTWLLKHYRKIVPAGDTQFTVTQLRDTFPDVVYQDFSAAGKIYALPLYIDTLALYYNRDIFDKNGIAVPPKDWLDLQNLIPKLTTKDASGNIKQSAVAIGGSKLTVNEAPDILSLLMLQAGAKMTDDEATQATFAQNVSGSSPGPDALAFYSKFSDSKDIYYTWNDNLEKDTDSFAKGNTAMIFEYGDKKNYIKEKNPFLNFKIASMPQPTNSEKSVNYADYWGLAVTNNSKNPDWAWDAILYLTANEAPAEQYFLTTERTPAMRTLIQKYADHPDLGQLIRQALSARSWPQISRPEIQKIFSDMIQSVITGKLLIAEALDQAQTQISELMRAQ